MNTILEIIATGPILAIALVPIIGLLRFDDINITLITPDPAYANNFCILPFIKNLVTTRKK